jgi:alpha-D-ribose 1-methylphosphonate 5-triphosphate synthase subunit PhnH
MFSNFFKKIAVFFEVMWKYIVEPDRPQMTICGMLIACWIPMAPNTHSVHVALIDFHLQKWLHERVSMPC